MTVENQTILKADEGKFLTNGDTYAKVVYIGKNDSSLNWHEITEEEYNQILQEQENMI